MAQSVKYLTLDLGSGNDLTVCGFEPCVGLSLTVLSLLEIHSLPLSLPLPCLCPFLSLKINPKKNQKIKKTGKNGIH